MSHPPELSKPQITGKRLAVFIPSFGDGGVERMMVNIATGVSGLGIAVDFITRSKDSPFLKSLPGNVNLIELTSSNRKIQLSKLKQYLAENTVDALISAKYSDDKLALKAIRQTRTGTKLFLRPGTALSSRMELRGKHWLYRQYEHYKLKKIFNAAHGIIAVSNCVAEQTRKISGVSPDKITVIRNPTLTPALYQQASEHCPHPWLTNKTTKIILGIGGLRVQKNFSVLVAAFSIVRQQNIDARLIILGEGRQRDRLSQQIHKLGLDNDVDLPGFTDNPYSYLAQSDLFVLSSLWEGSPNVLTEALAIGTPVVATDCDCGPREILQDGRYGPLVKINDTEGLAQAMISVLKNPLPAETLKEATREYTIETSAKHYAKALQLTQ
jgi:glycosyltransferase involved in cell wall biosynthesis